MKINNRNGMSLVEIILAMAILGIVVVLMTPVLGSAFNMITLSGGRHENAKTVAGGVENALAGEPITASLGDVSIALPGGIVVGGQKFELNNGVDARYVDLVGFKINSMSIVTPTGSVSTSTSTAATTATSATTSSATTVTGPTATSAPTSPPTTTTPTQAPIELKNVVVDAAAWRSDNRYGIIRNTTTAMEYLITNEDDSDVQTWTPCSAVNTTISLVTNIQGYHVVVRQITNITNNKHFRIRKAPIVAFHTINSLKNSFYIYDLNTLSWRAIISKDAVQLILTPNDTWTLVETGKEIKDLDTSYVYARLGANINGDGITIDDPASFPMKVTGYQ